MSNTDLLKELAKHVSILEMHVKRLKSKPEGVHEIDIDMMAEKLKELYSLVLELETGNAISEINEDEGIADSQVIEDEPEPEPESEPEKEREPIQEDIPTHKPEPEPVSVQEPDPIEEDPTTPLASQEPEMEVLTDAEEEVLEEPKTTADLFSETTTIADAYQSREDTSIAARVSPQTVEDLKMAIGINDKFLFINELFKGSPTEYNEAIDNLNAASALAEADNSMNNYRDRYEWSDQSEAYNRLKKIVQAKYS